MLEFDRNIIRCVIRLQTVNGDYEGTVKTVCDETGKIVLDKVSLLPEERKLRGVQNFFRKDILSLVVLRKSEVQPKKQTTRLPEEKGSKLLRLKPLPFSHKTTRNAVPRCDDTEGEASEVDDEPEEPFLKEGPIRCYYSATNRNQILNSRFHLPSTFLFIDSVDESFDDVITSIQQHSVIGVSMEGAPLRRDGDLCWLLISTKDKVYFFDLLSLHSEIITVAIKEIMENPAIVKVFHDCRLPSDVLFHKYEISVENVFDTKVADLMNYCRRHNNRLPEFARSISDCLEFYLYLNWEMTSCPKVRVSCMQKDLYEWKRRPLSAEFRDAALKKVVYLRSLRVAIMEELLSDVNAGTTLFLSVVRDASCEEISLLNLDDMHLIPPGMTKLAYRTLTTFDQSPNHSNKNRPYRGNKQFNNDIPSSSFYFPKKDDEEVFVGDLIREIRLKPNSVNNQKIRTRQSLPTGLPNTLAEKGKQVTAKHIRSYTTPSRNCTNGSIQSLYSPKKTHNASNKQDATVCQNKSAKVATKEQLQNGFQEVSEETNISPKQIETNVFHFATSTDGIESNISTSGEKFAWPAVSTGYQNTKQHCVPAGRLKKEREIWDF